LIASQIARSPAKAAPDLSVRYVIVDRGLEDKLSAPRSAKANAIDVDATKAFAQSGRKLMDGQRNVGKSK
jgi:hypothetical protein